VFVYDSESSPFDRLDYNITLHTCVTCIHLLPTVEYIRRNIIITAKFDALLLLRFVYVSKQMLYNIMS